MLFPEKEKSGQNVMDVPYVASWFVWGTSLSRKTIEVIIRIFIENPLELRVAWLSYQIKNSAFVMP
jgi:hypothetical protein